MFMSNFFNDHPCYFVLYTNTDASRLIAYRIHSNHIDFHCLLPQLRNYKETRSSRLEHLVNRLHNEPPPVRLLSIRPDL